MAQTAVTADLHQSFDVLRILAAKISFDLHIRVDILAELGDLTIVEITDPCVGVNTGLRKDFLGTGQANAVKVSQSDFDAFITREVDTTDTSH